ncbi:MAG: hypothetical protein VX466_10585 [Myxococcota bacterium]|nr:hypothetical protein [Myxococcota bacterium]
MGRAFDPSAKPLMLDYGSGGEIFELLRSAEHPFRRIVALEESPGFARPSDPASLRPGEIASYEPESVRIRIRPARESLLVLSDTWYPGWVAEVDGEPRNILRANGMYRAVRVGPDDREVHFSYRPASFRMGALLSLAGLVVALVVAASRSLSPRALAASWSVRS